MADRSRRVYIAGPDIFMPDRLGILARKKAVCAQNGLEGITPFDNEVPFDPNALRETAQKIYHGDRDIMLACDWCIANASPFRGVSIDCGTAFEIGYMCALGRTVFAYSVDPRPYAARVQAAQGDELVRAHTEGGWMMEDFELLENLMIPFGVEDSGGEFFAPGDAGESEDALFLRCVEGITARLGAS
ncbi:MAG: nucleoside 2-deoxyribosyltransferase [Pseudomonadota bacterium]